MKLTFYSNFLNHHQLPFCQAMIELIGDGFVFVATEPIATERVAMGYADMNKDYPFVLRTYEGEAEYEKAKCLSEESDVIILGSAPNEFVDIRIQHNLLTFKYAERFFKQGTYRRFIPSTRNKIFNGYMKYRDNNFYILSASAYTSYDLSLCGFSEDKCFKWGYFPKCKKQNVDELMEKKRHDVPQLLCAGRLLDWKHIKDAILVAKLLRDKGHDFSLKIIGSGVYEDNLKAQAKKYKLNDRIEFLGSMSPEKVREHMESSNIYLFTSNFYEGWGAVLNEAMNSGCAVVASHAIGSVPYLIKNGYNGIIYKYGNLNDFYNKVKFLFENPQLQVDYGTNSYYTIKNTWNAEVAAERLLQLVQGILNGHVDKFEDGPCSKANILKNSWFK